MASDSPGIYRKTHHHHVTDSHDGHEMGALLPGANGTRSNCQLGVSSGYQRDGAFGAKDSGYYVSTSDGASTCSSSTTEAGEGEGGTLLVLEPKSLRSFTTNDEYLYAMKEDLADWFSCLYQNDDITAENFFQVLETGVLLCKHANKVQDFARQRREKGETLEMRSYFIRSVPEGNVPYREGVKPETFQARDNVSNFISWGRQLGIPEVLSFETDDLVLRKNEKSVILCLLEIARVGAKLGMLAPTLVQMEQEIDAELAGEEPKPRVQIKTCDMRSLDERVRDLIGRCTCPVQFPMIKVGEGKYKIGDSRSLIFVRILRNHVMVRVGGGWDTLENYLNKHDPCQCMYRGHRAGSAQVSHKITVSQPQRRASTPGNNAAPRPAPNTPTSPRRMSSAVAADRNRPSSPQTTSGQRTRSKSPTLVISRNAPVASKAEVFSSGGPAPENKGGRVTSSQQFQGVAPKGFSSSSNTAGNTPSSQPVRCKSPSPGRLRSPSPLTTSHSAAARPSVIRTSSSSALLKGRDMGQEHKATTPRKSGQGNLSSDNEDDDDYIDNDSYFAEDEECDIPHIADGLSGAGSVSFDERAELQSVVRSSSSSLERVSESESVGSADGGGGKANVSMDKISTMTLSEFKSLLNSTLSVPEEQQLLQQQQQQQHHSGGGRSPGQSQGDPSRPLNWDSLREKARSVRDSISSSVNARRTGAPGHVIGRRSLPQSPDEDKGRPSSALGMERPKTPKALRRNVDTSNSNVISRPKTPTSIAGYRPKTPSGLERTGPKEEYKMARPKTPSQLKRDAVAKVAGAISNWVESRNEIDTASNRPKTPTRPKTPVGSRTNLSQKSLDSYDDDEDDNSEIAGVLANPQVQVLASTVRERPSTPSRIPKPCFTPRPSTPKTLSSLAIDPPREDISPSSAPTQQVSGSCVARPNTVSANRPNHLYRSNSNSSSVKSFDETPSSPASSYGDDRSFKSAAAQQMTTGTASSRKLPTAAGGNAVNNSNNSNVGRGYKDIYSAKRGTTSGSGSSETKSLPSRAVTPGPRERWTINGGGASAAGPAPGTQRRGSLNATCQIEKPAIPKKPIIPKSDLRRTFSASNLEPDQQMSITNEITFSDDEEINELVKNAAFKAKMSNADKRARSASVDARRLVRQNAKEKKEEVVIINRDKSGHHGVQVLSGTEIKYNSTPKSNVLRRPSSRGSSTDRSAPAANVARFRSQTPEPFMFRQKISTAKGSNEAESATSSNRGGDKNLNRTEAWVDSTLSDTKRKPPPRSKRAKGFGNEIPASELAPRSLEEIKAMLSEPRNGYVHVDAGSLEVPAEDPEMFRKMEKVFEKYREMELKASVNETPGAGSGGGGGGPVPPAESADSHSAKGGSQGSGHGAVRSTPSVASMKTSSGASSGHSSSRVHSAGTRRTSSSTEDNRFTRSSSVPGSFQAQLQRSSSKNSSTVNSPSQETKEFIGSGSSCQNGPQSGQSCESESNPKGPGSLKDIDPEIAKNPTALISKIKEILQVRPRKDENSRVRTRIPAPASLHRYSRSKSVSNLCSDDGDHELSMKQTNGRSVLNHTNSVPYNNNNHNSNNHMLRKANSTSSGNIAYSEFIYTDDGADEVPELTRTASIQSDSSDSQNRCETPVPKLAMPLTTGRSTLISKRGDRFGRGLSQDKENNLSNSQSSLSSRSVLSATEDEADFV